MICSIKVWYGLKSSQITELEQVDEYLLRKILNAHSKTAKEMLYLETAAVPIEFILKKQTLILSTSYINERQV